MLGRIHLPLVALLLGAAACATTPPVNPGGPRRGEPAYPVLLTDNQQRKEAATAAWAQLAQQQGESNSAPVLQPVTQTIRNLPENLNTPLYLPRVGTGPEMNEEETRESLRRFLNTWQKLLGANPAQLSLAQQTKDATGANLVVYEQRPFTYPLRGAYGRIEIRFAGDRRISSLSSTAIPDADKIQTALNASVPRLKSEEIATHLGGRAITYTDSGGRQQSYVIGPGTTVEVQQVVIYPIVSSTKTGTLEFHLVWEINLTAGPVKTIYYDALEDQVIAAS